MFTLGIDIGSTASKAVIIDENKSVLSWSVCSLGTGTSGAKKVMTELFEKTGLDWKDIAFSVATGYGRQRFDLADEQISEISCHARGVNHLLPGTRTVIDIGGQDAKALRLNSRGILDNFIMNEKCAAGTGRFLDVMAGVIESDVSLLGELDSQASNPVEISSTCTVFAESEVISHLSMGEKIPDIVAGIHNSVARRAAGLVKRLGAIEQPVAMSGGVSLNKGVVRALERELCVSIAVPDNSQMCGALGAALYALDYVCDE